MKPGAGHAKGAAFERDICRQLSLWWTSQQRDDIFWRTPQSGGRATHRAQKNKGTAGHYGDIMAVDPIGNPLLKFMTFELKHGYGGASAMDLLDGGPKSLWRAWIIGAMRVCEDARSRYWAVIARRHCRKTVICYPSDLRLIMADSAMSISHASLTTPNFPSVDIVLLEDFFVRSKPRIIAGAIG
jgi:hypothetical protein